MNQSNKFNKPFVRGDPFTYLLVGKMNASVWVAALVFAFLVNIPIMLLALRNNALFSHANTIGLLQDFGWWINQILVVPATIIFFFWMPDGINTVLLRLKENRVIRSPKDNKNNLDEYISDFDRIYSNWIWFIVVTVVITIYTIFVVAPVEQLFNSWQTTGKTIFWYTIINWNLVWILVALIVVRVIITITWFNKLFKQFEIDLKILHPDNAGGLSPLGSFSVAIGYLIGIFGLSVVISGLMQSFMISGEFSGITLNAPVIFETIAYIVLAPYAFFAPIGAAHSAMKKKKRNMALRISAQYERDFKRLERALDSNPAELGKRYKKIELLQKFHKTVNDFPVWPFNTSNLIRFFTSIGLPLLLAVLSNLLGIMFK
jgi:hypothetical protein